MGIGLYLMAAVPEPLLMTVEQYRQLPRRDDVLQELRWGKVFDLTRPKMKHAKLQSRLVRLLRPKLEHLGFVESEVAFRALPEYDLRGADVAFVSRERWEETSDDDNLRGSPEIVIEILSPPTRIRRCGRNPRFTYRLARYSSG